MTTLPRSQNTSQFHRTKTLYIESQGSSPGETVSIEYTVIIENPGTYTLNPVKISYSNMDRVYELQSETTCFNALRPSMVENLGNTVNTVLDADQELSQHIPDNLSTGLKIATYTVILYSVADSLRRLRSWILV